MKLEEAIEILTKWREEESVDDEVELHKAEALSIEALEAIIVLRDDPMLGADEPLPGETEEVNHEP